MQMCITAYELLRVAQIVQRLLIPKIKASYSSRAWGFVGPFKQVCFGQQLYPRVRSFLCVVR